MVSSVCSVYFNIIITWTLYYLGSSFAGILPWGGCDNDWNSIWCSERGKGTIVNGTVANGTEVYGVVNGTNTSVLISNVTDSKKWMSPAEEFWQ